MQIVFESQKCTNCPAGDDPNFRMEPACRFCGGTGTACNMRVRPGEPEARLFKDIGDLIQRVRVDRRISMGQMAANLKLPIVQYSMLEHGQTDPRSLDLAVRGKIHVLLGVDITNLG